MSETINKHGLKRRIDPETKRQIRKNCGFGCVICGFFICEYEHVDPLFCDSLIHDPDKMALLCLSCHGKVNRGLISKSTVIEKQKTPYCKSNKKPKETLHPFNRSFYIKLAGMTFINCQNPIEINGIPLFSIKKSDEHNNILFSGTFYDDQGNENLSIIDNELVFNNKTWDIEHSGNRFIFRKSKGDHQLRLRIDSQNGIIVERIKMKHGLYFFDGNQDDIQITYLGIQKISIHKSTIENCRTGLSLNCEITKQRGYLSIRTLIPVLIVTKTGIAP